MKTRGFFGQRDLAGEGTRDNYLLIWEFCSENNEGKWAKKLCRELDGGIMVKLKQLQVIEWKYRGKLQEFIELSWS